MAESKTQSCVTRKIVLHLITSGSSFSEAFNSETDSVHKSKKKSDSVGCGKKIGEQTGRGCAEAQSAAMWTFILPTFTVQRLMFRFPSFVRS